MKIEPQRTLRYLTLRFKRLPGDPAFLATGVAVGIFVGVTPTIPFHTVLVLALAFILRGSKIAALLASLMVSNPLTFFMQYYLSWRTGAWLIHTDLSWERISRLVEYLSAGHGFSESLTAVTDLGREAIMVLVVGGCILALPLAVAGYVFSFYFFSALRKKRRKKHLLK